MTRDGIDQPPLDRCDNPCGACGRVCRRSIIDIAIRRDGWEPIANAPLARHIDDDDTVQAIKLLGLTADGRAIKVRYRATGDYLDLWVDMRGKQVQLTHFKRLDD